MSKLPETGPSLLRYLRAQKRVTTRLANSTPYALSGTSVVAPGLMKVDERLVAGTPGGSRVELDSAGLRKYAADGTTVQVDLTGEVAAFSGLITGSEIVGGVVKTSASGARVELIPSGAGGVVRFYTGSVNETGPGKMSAAGGISGDLVIEAPDMTGAETPRVILTSTTASEVGILADYVYINSGGEIETEVTTLETAWDHATGHYLMRRIFVVANATARTALVAKYVAGSWSRVIDSTHPIFVWKADESAGAQLQYTTDGTTWTVIGGGGGTPLFADPNADRLVFWDDSAGAFAALTASTGLVLTGTDLTVRSATDALMGGVELATSAETITGTDDTRVVTPAGVKAATVPGAWTAPTLTNSWVDFGGGYQTAAYRKTANGDVELRGIVKSGAPNVPMFTLPAGFRPPATDILANVPAGAGTVNINVNTAGEIWPTNYGGGGTNGNVCLTGLYFSTL